MSTVVLYDTYGTPDVLRVAEEDVRDPGDGEVLVANRSIGVNPADAKRLAGGFGASWELPGVLGFEAAGVVEAIGPSVEGLAVGDEVLWHGAGAQRERALVRADHVRIKPGVVGFDQAAVLPVAAATAFSALIQAGVGASDVVLVHGASGGVGSAAVQIAVALGARVVGTTSESNREYVRWLGATPVAYGPGLADRVHGLPDGLSDVSAVVDLVGNPNSITASVDVLGGLHGVGLISGGGERAVTTVRSDASRAAGISGARPQKGALDEVIALAGAGLLHLEIAERFPLEHAADAVRLVGEGHVRGKVVLAV